MSVFTGSVHAAGGPLFLESVLKPSKRRLGASFSARTALIGLEIRQDSRVQSPCLTKKSAPIRHSANFKTASRKSFRFSLIKRLRTVPFLPKLLVYHFSPKEASPACQRARPFTHFIEVQGADFTPAFRKNACRGGALSPPVLPGPPCFRGTGQSRGPC